jgi:hypothetical protein
VQITWPNGRRDYVGEFSSEGDATKYMDRHAWWLSEPENPTSKQSKLARNQINCRLAVQPQHDRKGRVISPGKITKVIESLRPIHALPTYIALRRVMAPFPPKADIVIQSRNGR